MYLFCFNTPSPLPPDTSNVFWHAMSLYWSWSQTSGLFSNIIARSLSRNVFSNIMSILGIHPFQSSFLPSIIGYVNFLRIILYSALCCVWYILVSLIWKAKPWCCPIYLGLFLEWSVFFPLLCNSCLVVTCFLQKYMNCSTESIVVVVFSITPQIYQLKNRMVWCILSWCICASYGTSSEKCLPCLFSLQTGFLMRSSYIVDWYLSPTKWSGYRPPRYFSWILILKQMNSSLTNWSPLSPTGFHEAVLHYFP